MAPKIDITIIDGALVLRSPYNTDVVATMRRLGGKWRDGAWHCDARDEARVRAACKEAYGTDGVSTDPLCTLRIEWGAEGESEWCSPIEINGRTIARAFGRDSGAKRGDGVVLLRGGFSSGGSVKNWRTEVRPGTVVLLRDYPQAQAEALVAACQPDDKRRYAIEPEAPVIDRPALEGEKVRLLARLAEIDALLAGTQQMVAP